MQYPWMDSSGCGEFAEGLFEADVATPDLEEEEIVVDRGLEQRAPHVLGPVAEGEPEGSRPFGLGGFHRRDPGNPLEEGADLRLEEAHAEAGRQHHVDHAALAYCQALRRV